MDISLNDQQRLLTFCLCVVHYHIKGSVSQIFYSCLSLNFMKSRTLSLKNNKKLPVFFNKINKKT